MAVAVSVAAAVAVGGTEHHALNSYDDVNSDSGAAAFDVRPTAEHLTATERSA